MFKDVLNHTAGLDRYAVVGLVMFVFVFACVTLNVLIRSRRDVADWSRLPLAEDENRNEVSR